MKLNRGFCLLCTLAAASSAASAQASAPQIELAPAPGKAVRAYALDPAKEPTLSDAEKLRLVREHVKHVFILFQENRSFDFYFGSYPGADGLYSKPATETPGFVQPIVDVDGTIGTISPFKIPATVVDANGKTVPLYPQDIGSVNHAHLSIARKLGLDAQGVAQNNEYALAEEGVTLIDGKPAKFPTLERKQFGELVMSHVDCDTVPFLWQYANRFTLFDHFFDTVVGPSGPNAIAMIAGQSGETQWMLHPNLGDAKDGSALPMVANAKPYWGLALDKAGLPARPEPSNVKGHAPNMTFATLPLSFMGSDIGKTTATDFDPVFDLTDVKADIEKIAGHGAPAVNWGWYQQGYGHEPTDPEGIATHKDYVIHHNGPQYFGYVANNPQASIHMHGLGAFFEDVAAKRLPESGVFYVRGGYGNIQGFKVSDPNPKLATVFDGNDDHPGYSDSQITEAALARAINAIAESPYWKDSVILIAYDESDGLYDHARPKVRTRDAAGMALDQGPRIPMIMISPYGVAHGISHEPAEHSSIIRMVDELFNLIPLADLPDEQRARAIGVERTGQKDLGPADDQVAGVGNLLTGFDNLRLLGKRKLLPASYAEIPEATITTFPHFNGNGCRALGLTPMDAGGPNPVPKDFNPRPDTTPGIPASGTWVP